MMLHALLAALAVSTGQTAPQAVARVMHCRGVVMLYRDGKEVGRIHILQELFDRDELRLEAKGALILDYRAGYREQIGAREPLAEKISLTVTSAGCQPARAMERIKLRSAAQFTNLLTLPLGSRAGRAAGMVFRSADLPAVPPPVQPMWGATLLNPRPDFSWRETPTAAGYIIELQTPSGEPLWSRKTPRPRLAFPTAEKALSAGGLYRWQVSEVLADGADSPLYESKLLMANAAEQKLCAPWLDVLADGGLADRLHAAAVFQKVGAYHESQRIFELLHREAPKEPFFAAALADHYQRGGRVEDADRQSALAKRLGFQPFEDAQRQSP